MEKFSAEHFCEVATDFLQPQNGYRFSTDSLILAASTEIFGHERIIDIGTGSGILPLILASKYPGLDIVGVEIQKELYQYACQNISTHKLENKINLINKDINDIKLSDIKDPVDLIVSNPPYKKKGSGRLNPDSQKAMARHEMSLDINQLFKCSKQLLKEHGSLYLIFPAERISDLLSAMTDYQFTAKEIRFVHTKQNAPAKRVILCAVKNSHAPCTISAPLYVYSNNGQHTSEYLALINPDKV